MRTHTHTHTYTHTYVHTHTHRVRQTDIQTDLTSSHCKCRTNVVETDQSNAACAWDVSQTLGYRMHSKGFRTASVH